MDEAAFMKSEAWINGIRPALADRQGWAIFLTTPSGMNWIHDLFETAGGLRGLGAGGSGRRRTTPSFLPKELEAARRDMGELQFAQEHLAQFVVAGSGMFKPEWFEHRYDHLPENHYRLPDGTTVPRDYLGRFGVVDLAVSTKTTADYTVVGAFGATHDNKLLVLEIDRARREGPAIVPAMREMVERHRLNAIWVEKVGFQLALIQQARAQGLPVRELTPDRDKVARAMPATAALEGGRVLLPQAAPWLRNFVDEVLSFPVGQHDDQVDVLSYAVEVVRTGYARQRLSLSNMGGAGRPRRRKYDIRDLLDEMHLGNQYDRGRQSQALLPGDGGGRIRPRAASDRSVRVRSRRPTTPRRSRGPRPDAATREARQDARLLLMVVRARLREGVVPVEHADRLAAVAQDGRVQVRRRRVAAELLGKMRLEVLRRLARAERGAPETGP